MCAQRHPVDENRGPAVRKAPILVYSANAFTFRCLWMVEKRVSIRVGLLIGFWDVSDMFAIDGVMESGWLVICMIYYKKSGSKFAINVARVYTVMIWYVYVSWKGLFEVSIVSHVCGNLIIKTIYILIEIVIIEIFMDSVLCYFVLTKF